MSINQDHIVGATSELLKLFNQQTAILESIVASGKVTPDSKEQLAKINEEFNFLDDYLQKEIKFEDNQRFIGKMLLDAKRQATAIVNEAKSEAASIKDVASDDVVSVVEIVQESTLVEKNEPDIQVEIEKETEQVGRFAETRAIHQKYKDSLDNILKEIDLYFEN